MIALQAQAFVEYPELAVAVALLVRLALAWQRGLSWYEYRTLHGIKRLTFPTLDRLFPGNIFVNDKGGQDDSEYLTTMGVHYRDVVGLLRDAGGHLHLVSSIKRRPAGYGDTLSAAHVVFPGGSMQVEAYLFRNDDGSTDVYAHHETAPTDPEGHLTDPQFDGDPTGVIYAALDPDLPERL